jgi:hypothetical protein
MGARRIISGGFFRDEILDLRASGAAKSGIVTIRMEKRPDLAVAARGLRC